MDRGLVLRVSLIQVLPSHEELLEAVHTVGNYSVKDGDRLHVMLSSLDRLHQLHNLELVLQCLRGLESTITLEKLLDARIVVIEGKVNWVLPSLIF